LKTYCFILSHEGAGSHLLARILNSTKKVACLTDSHIAYAGPESLETLNYVIKNHPCINDDLPIYCDTLNHNTDLYYNNLFDFCKIIFLTRQPEPTLKAIATKNAYNYYRFRLRRLYEYSKKAKNSICITYDEIVNRQCFPLIESFLNIKDPISDYYEAWPTDGGELSEGKILRNIKQPNVYVPVIQSNKYERYLNAIRRNSGNFM
jgi:hypothetical protein